jgi:hypothetical protein
VDCLVAVSPRRTYLVRKTYRQARSTARIAQESRLALSLALVPPQCFQLGETAAFGNKMTNALERNALGIPHRGHDEDPVPLNPCRICSLQGCVEERDACKQDLRPGRLELMRELGHRVGGIRRACYPG